MAGCYALLMLVVLYFDFKSPDGDLWGVIAFLLTLPWSILVVLAGFLLIHISAHGQEYGYVLGAVINTLLLYFIGRSRGRGMKFR